MNGATTANYTYNGNGQRVKKVVNGTTTIFHYSLSGQVIGESDNTGAITAEYVYLNDQPLAKIEGANTYYYHNDHLATPQKMTDAFGTVVWAADYKPFGEATITVSTITNNLRFPGQYYDAETGLNYNYYRDYHPTIGRYVEADQIGILEGENHLYAYTDNDPLNWSDPDGLSPVGWIVKVTNNGIKIVSPLMSKAAAVLARKQGLSVLAKNKQTATAIQCAVSHGQKNVLKHKGHTLPGGTQGLPHVQSPGNYGHTFWGSAISLIGSLLDPFDPISGQLD